MPPRLPRLPTFTLFTGPNCSLCDVAKADLAELRKKVRSCSFVHSKSVLTTELLQVPFNLEYYNIKRVEDDPDEYNRTAWRRLYQVRSTHRLDDETLLTSIPVQYDIPVLHLHPPGDSTLEGLSGKKAYGGRVQKHRIDKEKLQALVKEWTVKLNEQETKE